MPVAEGGGAHGGMGVLLTSAIYYHVQTTPFQRSQHHLAFSVVAPFRKVTVPKADTRGAPRLLGLVIVFEVSSIAYS